MIWEKNRTEIKDKNDRCSSCRKIYSFEKNVSSLCSQNIYQFRLSWSSFYPGGKLRVLSTAGTLITITYTLELPVVSKVSNKLQDIKVKSASERPVKTWLLVSRSQNRIFEVGCSGKAWEIASLTYSWKLCVFTDLPTHES